MRGCPEGCDASCYRCLRSFKNKFEHRYLDRHVGIELLEYLVHGVCKPFDTTRVRNSTKVLADDLARHCPEYDVDLFKIIEVPGHGQVEIPILVSDKNGRRWAVALSGPLTERRAADPLIAQMQVDPDAMAVEVVNELLVRGNIADATRRLRAQLEGAQ